MDKLEKKIWTYLKTKDYDELKSVLSKLDVIEILDIMRDLLPEEQVILYRLLSKDTALTVFEELDTYLQQKLLASFNETKAKEIIADMRPDDRVRLLEELPAAVAKRLTASLSPESRLTTSLLMGYEEETAGRIMTPEYVKLKKDFTAEESLYKIRNTKNKETFYSIYVVDDTGKLEGVLSLKDLVMASPETKIKDIMSTKIIKVYTDTDQEESARTLQEFHFLALPVVDKEERLVGIITIDDAMDVIEEETTEDIFDKAGLIDLTHRETDRSNRLVNGSLLDVWKVRLPFLIITMIGGLLAGAVIGVFEDTLEAIAAIAIFIPVIMDMGGNAGTQSSTIFTRALILGHINIRKFWKHLGNEVLVGLSMGVIVGVTTGIIAGIWQGMPQLGLSVGLALTITMTLATTLGFFIPFVLVKIGVDQAAGADPIITTIKDISGLVIYFLLVRQFLAYLL